MAEDSPKIKARKILSATREGKKANGSNADREKDNRKIWKCQVIKMVSQTGECLKGTSQRNVMCVSPEPAT